MANTIMNVFRRRRLYPRLHDRLGQPHRPYPEDAPGRLDLFEVDRITTPDVAIESAKKFA